MNLAEVKSKYPLVEVFRLLGIALEKRTGNYRTKCVFHEEKTPSLFVSDTKNVFYCFGYGAAGDLFHLLIKLKGYNFIECVKFLSGSCVPLPPQTKVFPPSSIRSGILSSNIKNIYRRFYDDCCLSLPHPAKEYLLNRGIHSSHIEKKNMGWCLPFEEASKKLESHHALSDLIDSGLYDKKGRFLFLHHRLVWPYYDTRKEIVFFQARDIDFEIKKNANPERLYKKELNICRPFQELYNTHNLKIPGVVVVTEGVMDCITLASRGYNALGMPSTIFLTEWASLLQENEPVFLIDLDMGKQEEFQRKIERIGEAFKKGSGKHLRYTFLPEGMDINDFFKDSSKNENEKRTCFDEILLRSRILSK